jgi:hypothetical protein
MRLTCRFAGKFPGIIKVKLIDTNKNNSVSYSRYVSLCLGTLLSISETLPYTTDNKNYTGIIKTLHSFYNINKEYMSDFKK